MSAFAKPSVETRRCVFCGKAFAVHLRQCPFCREMVPQVQLSRRTGADGRPQIRRGLLYMLLAALLYYFASGYAAPFQLPVSILPLVNNYLLPLLFLGGLGFTLYGFFLRIKS